MYNLDSLSLKYFFEENKDFISNSIVQKIQLPDRHAVILNLRNIEKKENRKLYININPKYPHICFIDENGFKKRNINIPSHPPMFCMQLRKYLNGSKIKDFRLVKYERILELYFDYFDEIGSISKLCLALEFMGKHSNIILYNSTTKVIIGSIHNVSPDKSSIREVYGGIKYIYPPLKNKQDILNISYNSFHSYDFDVKKISENIYYFSQSLLKKIKLDENSFSFMQQLQNGENPQFVIDFWGGGENINDAIDNYFSKIMFEDISNNIKSKLKNYLKNDIKKYSKTVENKLSPEKLEKYKQNADLIMAYMYDIKKGQNKLVVGDLAIELDPNKSPNDNAQKYYNLYKKAKAGYKYNVSRVEEAKNKLEYYNSIVFNIENSSDFDELAQIEQELIELGFINKKKEIVKAQPKKLEFQGYDIYLGKNNIQNDYLISKIASGEDLWFHGLNFPSSHLILKVPNNKKYPPREVLEFCARTVKENSKAKNSGKTSIIMTKRKNLKKPPNTYLGYVTYKNETEIVID